MAIFLAILFGIITGFFAFGVTAVVTCILSLTVAKLFGDRMMPTIWVLGAIVGVLIGIYVGVMTTKSRIEDSDR